MELTLEQKKELNSWSEKRDSILKEISVISIQLEEKNKKSIELSESNTEIETRINQGKGRLIEIDEKEKERSKLISKEISDLQIEKSTLQVEVSSLKKEVGGLKSEKGVLIEVIDSLKKVHSDIFAKANGLDKIVEQVNRMTTTNISDFKLFFEELKNTVQSVIDGNKKVISETNIMVQKVPKILREVTTPIRIIRPILNKKRLAAKGDIPK
jgi:chromosome segregation ATPase